MNDHNQKLKSLGLRIEDAVAGIGCSFSAFVAACIVVIVWAATGPHFSYSDTWQLIINTGTTIVTFLMAFLIGANQRRADAVRAVMMAMIEQHVTLIEDHTEVWQKHASETHRILCEIHSLTHQQHPVVPTSRRAETQSHVADKEEIETLQRALARIEINKLDKILQLLEHTPAMPLTVDVPPLP